MTNKNVSDVDRQTTSIKVSYHYYYVSHYRLYSPCNYYFSFAVLLKSLLWTAFGRRVSRSMTQSAMKKQCSLFLQIDFKGIRKLGRAQPKPWPLRVSLERQTGSSCHQKQQCLHFKRWHGLNRNAPSWLWSSGLRMWAKRSMELLVSSLCFLLRS